MANKRLIKNRDTERLGTKWALTFWGKERGEKMLRNPDPDPAMKYNEGMMEVALTAWSWFERPQLDPKTRALCIICALTARGGVFPAKGWTVAALNLGCTGEQIQEAVRQVIPYCGLYPGNPVMAAVNEAIKNYKRPRARTSATKRRKS